MNEEENNLDPQSNAENQSNADGQPNKPPARKTAKQILEKLGLKLKEERGPFIFMGDMAADMMKGSTEKVSSEKAAKAPSKGIIYPEPRVKYTTDPDDVTIGIYKGDLVSSRPFVADIWWWDNYVGVTYRFSNRDLESATDDELIELLYQSRQIQQVTAETRKLISGFMPSVDENGNEIMNISIHLGFSDRMRIEKYGVVTSTIFSEIEDMDEGIAPIMKIIHPDIQPLIRKYFEE